MSSQATDTHMAYSLEEFTYKLTNPISRCHKRTSCVLRGLNHAHAPVKHHTQIFKFIIIPMTPRDRWYLPPLFSQPGWGGAGRDHGHSQFYSKHPKVSRKRKKEKTTQAVKATPHINKEGKGTTLVPSNVLQLQAWKFFASLFSDGTQLPYTDTFKYLGMVCNRQINLNIAADAALWPFMAGTCRVKQFVKRSHDLGC